MWNKSNVKHACFSLDRFQEQNSTFPFHLAFNTSLPFKCICSYMQKHTHVTLIEYCFCIFIDRISIYWEPLLILVQEYIPVLLLYTRLLMQHLHILLDVKNDLVPHCTSFYQHSHILVYIYSLDIAYMFILCLCTHRMHVYSWDDNKAHFDLAWEGVCLHG